MCERLGENADRGSVVCFVGRDGLARNRWSVLRFDLDSERCWPAASLSPSVATTVLLDGLIRRASVSVSRRHLEMGTGSLLNDDGGGGGGGGESGPGHRISVDAEKRCVLDDIIIGGTLEDNDDDDEDEIRDLRGLFREMFVTEKKFATVTSTTSSYLLPY
ncbi:hypothetical protein RB195_013109 [Necator americanus]|uniref:Uncharacterized protein n=1 Tax=Necator americanus TaxID=51031 RepID=A0ABR1DU05_NECAM